MLPNHCAAGIPSDRVFDQSLPLFARGERFLSKTAARDSVPLRPVRGLAFQDDMTNDVGDAFVVMMIGDVIGRLKAGYMPVGHRHAHTGPLNHARIIGVVGEGLAETKGVAARVFSAVAAVNTNVEMISSGASKVATYFIVKEADIERTVSAIHREFFGAY